MKYLSRAHLQKLEELKKERLLLECVEELERVSIPNAFPPKREDYYAFAEHIYNVAQEYGLRDRRAIFALLFAWHIKGDGILEDRSFIEVLGDTTLSSAQKSEFIEKHILDAMPGG